MFTVHLNGLCAETVGPNLLPNPGFEDGVKLPAGWRTWADGVCCTFVWDKTNAHGGQRSVYLCNTFKFNSMAWIASCPLKEDTFYRFSAWIKVNKAKNSRGAVYLRVRGFAKGADWEEAGVGKGDGTGGKWEFVKWDFKTPPGLGASSNLWLQSFFGDGDQVWFDDVELKELAK